ncbi:hypothetical protein [Paraburkholderia caribensis]|uniref:hypothetical protein n=1 Tax=Paraburkholderia caribensis TaxID=75105 RepID=UPI001CB1EE0B|nr:hypothetical protein [Paraburkholderia caribensis]CAG9269760.1 conserved hypothetical protein [Paraburkholderia caribensis]
MEKKEKIVQEGFNTALGGFNELQNTLLNNALSDYSKKLQDSLTTKAGDLSRQSMAVKQGFLAEAHHAGSYNIEAAAKGQNNHRATLDVGRVNDPVTDIRINTPKGSKDFQLKFYEDGEKSAKAFNHGRYEDVGKVVPAEQLGDANTTATREAQRNSQTRPEVSKRYKKTADTLDATISTDDRPDIRSAPLKRTDKGGSEDLVRRTEEQGKGPEYEHKTRVRAEFNSMQYANAVKSGAIAGASITAASELIGLLRSDEPMTQEQCLAAAERVVIASLKGAGNAVLVTGIQHAGQSLLDSATGTLLKASGKHLVKGNVASAAASVVTTLGINIYRFSRGEIDSLEFAGSTISSSVSAVGGAMAYSGGTAVATYLGQWVAAEVASTAVLGTTLGALGPIALGTVFAIGFSMAMSAYVGHFSAQGSQIAIDDIQGAMKQLGHGEINMSQYCGLVGTMSQFKFEWKDLLPFAGSISVFGEYTTRKAQLLSVQRDLDRQIAALPEQERLGLAQLRASYLQQLRHIEQQYDEVATALIQQTRQRYDLLDAELTRHLEAQFVFFTPVLHEAKAERADLELGRVRQRQRDKRIESYRQQLQLLRSSLTSTDMSNDSNQELRQQMLVTVTARLQVVLPERTPWDEAYEFMFAA